MTRRSKWRNRDEWTLTRRDGDPPMRDGVIVLSPLPFLRQSGKLSQSAPSRYKPKWEMDLVRRYKSDLEPLKRAVAAFLGLGIPQRANGDCLPDRETRELYEPVKAEALKLLDFDPPYISEPIVRMKPSPEGGAKNSSFLHTDFWAGHNAYVVMIPIAGDFDKGGVEFFEATQNHDLLLRLYPDYTRTPDFKPKYLAKMEPGYVYVLDPRCLHRTMKGEMRISVDFRCAWNLDFPMAEHYASRNR